MRMRLRAGTRVSVLSADEVLLAYEQDGERYFRFKAPGVAAVWTALEPRLSTTFDPGDFLLDEAEPLVQQLAAHGLAVPADEAQGAVRHLAELFPNLGSTPSELAGVLGAARPLLLGPERFTGPLRQALAEWGVMAEPAPETDLPDDLAPILAHHGLAVVTTGPDSPLPSVCNQAALQVNRPWLNVSVDQFQGKIGPFVVPRQTACYRCHQLRYQSNVQFFREYQATHTRGRLVASPSAATPAVAMVSQLAAAEVVKWLLADRLGTVPVTLGKVMHLDAWGVKADLHPVLRFPRCPECGVRAEERPAIMPWMDAYEYQP